MSCIACRKPLDGKSTCPRCGFVHAPIIGNPVIGQKIQEEDAANHRISYLSKFDFGITCYHWKDQNGIIVLDTTERLSFGAGDQLFDNTVFLEQEFARLPDEEQLTVDISIQQAGTRERSIACQVPVLKDPLLQRLGLSLGLSEINGAKELSMMLTLKNEQHESYSPLTPFLCD